LALPELLGLLASARKTGALRLEAGPVSGVVHLEDGHCRAVETLEHAGVVQDGPALLNRLVDVCFAVTRQESGAFRFASDEPAPWRSDEPVELSDALVEVDRLLKQWREILQVIPSLDCRPRLLEALESDEVVLDRDQWALVVSVDGRRSVRELVARAQRPVIDVCHALLELVESGAVAIQDPADAAPAPSAPAAPAVTNPAPAAPTVVAAPAPAVAAPAASAPTAAPAAPQPAASAPASEPARQPVEPPKAEPPKAEAPKPEPANGRAPETQRPETQRPETQRPEAQPAEAQRVAATNGDEGGEVPDKGAFLRLFSGLRDG
jgi:hypothetical protein